jgi:nucleotide-binding universal stress UspA family protein
VVKLKSLLVPVDGSDCSIHALEYAAQRQKASPEIKVVVLHVQPSMRPSRVLTRDLIAEHQKRTAETALKPALAAARRLKLDVTMHTQIGDPGAAIIAFAKKKRCGEIVMGNSGLGALAGLVMGSVARKVVFLAKTPVVLVK